ncbi:MAG TPA: hypothetical protein VGS58_19895, partial [Candidatus Sulfopaludibacter sp.]|nr:hypothetical protein [Candidatus Sulfopaludibacter sp.]
MYPERMACSLKVLALLLYASAAPAQSNPDLCQETRAIAEELTQISGLKLRHPVPCSLITKAQVNEFLNKRIQEETKPDDIRAEELTLKKFGLVPQDFDLARTTVDLLTEQAAAFYDYEGKETGRKELFITESSTTEPQEPVLAHELSHALADQNFNLKRFIHQGRKSDDGSTARLAVMEGQATWLMSEYLARHNGQSLKTSPALVAMMSTVSDSGGGQYPVFDKAPLYLRLSLVFPYTKGMLFQHALVERDSTEGFSEVFRHPPLSTQQIIHPDKYFTGVKPTDPPLPDPHLPGYKGLVGGSLGEMEHEILLEQYAGKERAEALAPHWRGCNFELRENKKAQSVVLLYAVDWDSEESARQYFAAYREILGRKWKQMTVSADGPDTVTGVGDGGRFEL